jgi:RND family efflux transporter MFP subunit
MKMRKGIALAVVMVVVGMVNGCARTPHEIPAAEAAVAAPVSQRAVEVVRMHTLPLAGVHAVVLEPGRTALIGPLESGRIKRIAVSVGQRVAMGGVLASMDDGQLVAAIADFQPLKAQLDRAHRLFANNALSKADYEELEARYLAQKRRVTDVEDNTTIRAPFGGVVSAISAREGECFLPQQMANGSGRAGFIEMIQLDKMSARLKVGVHEWRKIKLGMKVNATIPALDTAVGGTVVWVSPLAAGSEELFEIGLAFDNRAATLQGGLRAVVRFPYAEERSVPAVARVAVNGGRVLVVRKGALQAVAPVLGSEAEGLVQVIEGLAVGDSVVVWHEGAL